MDGRGILAADSSLSARIGLLIEENKLTDVEFIIGKPGNIKSIRAHKLILAASSPVFHALFYGPLAIETDKTEVPDITPNGFSQMIRYIYTDSCVLMNSTDAFDIYRAADKYLISELKEKCTAYLARVQLQSRTVLYVLENSLFFQLRELKTRCLLFISKKTKEVMQSESFRNCTEHTVKAILELDGLNVPSENELFELVISWAVTQQEKSGGTKTLNEILKPILPLICFKSILGEDLCSIVEKYPYVFGTEEALSLLMNCVKPGSKDTPEWFNQRVRTTVPNVRIRVSVGPEILKLKLKNRTWYNRDIKSCLSYIVIKNLTQFITIYGLNIEFKVCNCAFPVPVSIAYLATADFSAILETHGLETAGSITHLVRELNCLHISFKHPIRLETFPFWIAIKLSFRNQIKLKYQQYSTEKNDFFTCVVSKYYEHIPLVSQLLYSKINDVVL